MKTLESIRKKGSKRKVRKFNAPKMLEKECGNEFQSSYPIEESSGTFTSHNLIMYFGDVEYHEENFSKDSCFLDILAICKKFIDVYSIGFKVTDGDGRLLKGDQDVMIMLKEHEMEKDIPVYLEKDEMGKPLSFRLPHDDLNLGSCSYVKPKVINVRISGDLRADKKVLVEGDVIDGNERVSIAQLFITSSKEFVDENGLEAISLPKTGRKEFELPQEAVGQYLIAKYVPVNADGKIGDSVYVVSDVCVENSNRRKVRGKNKNKAVALLQGGKKLNITFYKKRAVSDNHKSWSRHLGKIVRDRRICPVRVQTWKDISQSDKNHMWDAIKNSSLIQTSSCTKMTLWSI
ncbi:hypothetical protein Sjap_002841 [Stephania japonica]|uniref:AIR9-like A9 domain-containing protein n=1 Tax=Stephania japonica TaxID=461633 RepID=A0AAP0KML2_9MAGN